MCSNGVWTVTGQDVTTPTGTTQVTTAVSVVNGNFTQLQGSTLVFTASGGGGGGSGAPAVVVSGGGCAVLQGDAVVQFGAETGAATASAALVQAQCIEGQFGTTSAQASGANCESYGEGAQSVSGATLSAAFEVDRSGCGGGGGEGGALGTAAIAGIAAGGAVAIGLVVIGAALVKRRKRRAAMDAKLERAGAQMRQM